MKDLKKGDKVTVSIWEILQESYDHNIKEDSAFLITDSYEDGEGLIFITLFRGTYYDIFANQVKKVG